MTAPHAAVVTLTGWPSPIDTGIRIGRVYVHTDWRPEEEQRVTVRAFPGGTTPTGKLMSLHAKPGMIRPARTPNGTQVRVTGQLIRLDRQSGIVTIRVYPSLAGRPPFLLTLQATTDALRAVDPSTLHVTATGRILELGRPHLLAEHLQEVYAPIPARWAEWTHAHGRGAVIARSQARDDAPIPTAEP